MKNINDFFNDEEKKENSPFDNEVFTELPLLFQEIIGKFGKKHEKDIALLAAINVISGLCKNYLSYYDQRVIEPHHYAFIAAPYASGKGLLGFIRHLISPTDKLKSDAYDHKVAMWKADKKEGMKPRRELLIAPGNTSKAQLLRIIEECYGRITIFETEADSLTIALQSKFGEFGDILRNGFQGEPSSFTRATDDILVKIENTCITVLLSGTYNQVRRLIKDFEDGLFSRFDFLFLVSDPTFKDVLANDDNSLEMWFKSKGAELTDLYEYLDSLTESKIFFKYSALQIAQFHEYWGDIKAYYHEKYKGKYGGIINRQALKCTKIAMVLSLVRVWYESKKLSDLPAEIICSDADFYSAMSISTTLLDNNLKVAQMFSPDAVKEEYIKQKHEDLAQKEKAIQLWDSGIHSYTEIARRLGMKASDRATIMRWLRKGGRK